MIGTCEKCGEKTSSIAYKFCKSCAAKEGVCAMCLKPSGSYLCSNCEKRFVPM